MNHLAAVVRAISSIPFARTADFEIEIAVGEIWFIFAQVAGDAAGAGDRAGRRAVDRRLLRQNSDPFRPLDENAVAIEEPADVGVDLGEAADERPPSATTSNRSIGFAELK